MLHLLYPSFYPAIDGFSLFLAFVDQAAVDMDVQISLLDLPLNSFGYKLKSGMGRS